MMNRRSTSHLAGYGEATYYTIGLREDRYFLYLIGHKNTVFIGKLYNCNLFLQHKNRL